MNMMSPQSNLVVNLSGRSPNRCKFWKICAIPTALVVLIVLAGTVFVLTSAKPLALDDDNNNRTEPQQNVSQLNLGRGRRIVSKRFITHPQLDAYEADVHGNGVFEVTEDIPERIGCFDAKCGSDYIDYIRIHWYMACEEGSLCDSPRLLSMLDTPVSTAYSSAINITSRSKLYNYSEEGSDQHGYFSILPGIFSKAHNGTNLHCVVVEKESQRFLYQVKIPHILVKPAKDPECQGETCY